MKKLILLLFLFFANICLYGNSLEVGLGSIKFNYNEYGTNESWLDSETNSNSNFGVDGGYITYKYNLGKYNDDGRIYNQKLEFNYSYHQNTTFYNGYLQSLTTGTLTPYQGKTNNDLYQGDIRYKVVNKVGRNEIGLFTGLGYRYWDRNMQGKYGYLETYQWAYYEAGISLKWYDSNFFTGIDSSYQKAYKPTMRSYSNGGLNFDLGETKGYKYTIPFGYNINSSWSIALNYTYDEWKIKRSNAVQGFYEPRSITKNRYTYISLSYKF